MGISNLMVGFVRWFTGRLTGVVIASALVVSLSVINALPNISTVEWIFIGWTTLVAVVWVIWWRVSRDRNRRIAESSALAPAVSATIPPTPS